MPLTRLLVATLVLAALGLGTAPTSGAEKADLVLTNAVVHTVAPGRPKANAVAILGGRIAAVGTNAEV